MIGTTGIGWLFSLAQEPRATNWGGVESFYKAVKTYDIGHDPIIIDSEVWGTLQSTAILPRQGDGFAFYHSTRAKFPKPDSYGRKPRISLMGELLQDIDDRDMTRIRVAVDPNVLVALRDHPIIRDDLTRHLFENCGIVKGAIATLYHADHSTWTQFVAEIGRHAK
jgi:hypothetical protein